MNDSYRVVKGAFGNRERLDFRQILAMRYRQNPAGQESVGELGGCRANAQSGPACHARLVDGFGSEAWPSSGTGVAPYPGNKEVFRSLKIVLNLEIRSSYF